MQITLRVLHADKTPVFSAAGDNYVQLDLMNEPYRIGDVIIVETTEAAVELEMMLDACLAPSRVYLSGKQFEMPVPFDKSHRPYHPAAFEGNRIWGYVRAVDSRERNNWRNLALNSHDLEQQENAFPHASTNSGATDDRFMARNAIDGITQTCLHGEWPYGSWGISGREDAKLRICFGRTVKAEQLTLFLRADYPHDGWWKSARITASDGLNIVVDLKKTGAPQSFELGAHLITWIELSELIPGNDRPFPALSQIQVWGTNE